MKMNTILNTSLTHRNLISTVVYKLEKKAEKRINCKIMTSKTPIPQGVIPMLMSPSVSDSPRSMLPAKRNTAIKVIYAM